MKLARLWQDRFVPSYLMRPHFSRSPPARPAPVTPLTLRSKLFNAATLFPLASGKTRTRYSAYASFRRYYLRHTRNPLVAFGSFHRVY